MPARLRKTRHAVTSLLLAGILDHPRFSTFPGSPHGSHRPMPDSLKGRVAPTMEKLRGKSSAEKLRATHDTLPQTL